MILPVWAAREKAQPIVKSVSLATASRTASVQVSELSAEEGELSRRNISLVKEPLWVGTFQPLVDG